MGDQWIRLVEEKREHLEPPARDEVFCLRDEDVCCVDGDSKSISLLSAKQTIALL